MELNGKVAWVVGGSSGIGAAVARELVLRGIGRRGLGETTAAPPGRRWRDMLALTADVTDMCSVAAAAAQVQQDLGPIDLAVISAGYWKQMDPTDWDTEVFDRHVQVNLVGTSNTIAAVLPGMLRRRSGVIAGIASVAGYRGLAGAEAYGATKAAQINLLESLRVHVAQYRRAGHDGVPRLCTDRSHRRQSLPYAVHDREADRAARFICDGLERGRSEIAFPRRWRCS